jgi:hypothetical protein|tara:strand:+ start:1390 stop:1866 length:477 start_codon:yes stop_codon:yes gene_type:complete
MEQKILSPIDGNADYCFESYDQATDLTSYLDYKTGFTSNSMLIVESDYVIQAEKNQPKLVTELRVIDELRDLIWYPSVINIPLKGMVFPISVKDSDDWQWEVLPIREVTEEEKEKYPMPDKEGEFFKTIVDVKGKKNFDKLDFLSALKEIGGVIEENE